MYCVQYSVSCLKIDTRKLRLEKSSRFFMRKIELKSILFMYSKEGEKMKIFNTIKTLLDMEFFNILLSIITLIYCTLFNKNQIINFYLDEKEQPTVLISTNNYYIDLTFRNNQHLNLFINLLERFNFPIQRISIEQSISNYIHNKYGNELPESVVNSIVKQYLIEVK